MTRFSSTPRLGRRAFLAASAALVGATQLPTPARATPRKGGDFRVAVTAGGVSDTLNPAEASSAQQIVVGWGLRNCLTEIAADNSLAPELAQSWASDDGKTWIFQLRQGVTFHNGKSLGPEDVIASLNLHRGEDSTSGAKSLLQDVVDMTAEGAHGVKIVLKAANSDFPFILSDYHFQICPVGADGALDMSGTGTGGYILNEYNPGSRISMRRNPDYWKESAAHFDTCEVLLISDSAAATTALITGAVHAIQSAEGKTLSLLSRNADIEVESISGGYHPTYAMQTTQAPFTDNNVRLALKYAVDRQELVDRVLRGHGTVANDHPIAPSMPFYDASIEQREYDPDRARFHIKEAGFDTLKVSLSGADSLFAGAVDSIVLYREHAATAGIDIEVVREPSDGYWSDVWLKKPFVTSAWGARPVPDMILSTAYQTGGAWNETQFADDRFMQLLVAARSELDQSRRAQMYSDMQVILRDTGGAVIPFFRNHLYARRAEIARADQVASNWALDGYKPLERWWMA